MGKAIRLVGAAALGAMLGVVVVALIIAGLYAFDPWVDDCFPPGTSCLGTELSEP